MRPEDFYMRTRASQGVKFELVDPAGNREWMWVRSVESGEFKRVSREMILSSAREGQSLQGDSVMRKHSLRRRRAELASALVAEWSIPAEIDQVDLLIRNPRLRRQIELIAENHALHFGAPDE